MRLVGRVVGAVLLSAAVLTAAPVRAQYRVRDLGGTDFSRGGFPYGINAAGQVAGVSGTSAFFWSNGSFTDLTPGVSSFGRALNDSGEVVGDYDSGLIDPGTGNALFHAFVSTGGVFKDLGTLPGASYSRGNGINNDGNVVGYSGNRAFVYSRVRNALIPLFPPVGTSSSFANAICQDNTIVGVSYISSTTSTRHATLWRYDDATGTVLETRDLGTFDDPWRDSVAYGISRLGHVAGSAEDYSYGTRAFVWRDGVMTPLGTLPGFGRSVARSVNANGTAVGYSFGSDFPQRDHRAFVYQNGVLRNLTAEMPAGWTLYEAYSINDSGQIVGYGASPAGSSRMLLLEPDQAPTAQSDSVKTAGNTAITFNVLANDADPEGDPLQVTSNTLPSRGALTRNGGVFTYTPNAWTGGADSFTYTINDGYGATSTATVTILVTAANVTSQVTVTADPPRLDRKTGRYLQTVTIKRSGTGNPPLPLSLVLDGLTSGVSLVGAAGLTAETSPAGSPYVNVSNGADTVIPSKGLKVELVFASSSAIFSYTPRVLAGAGPR